MGAPQDQRSNSSSVFLLLKGCLLLALAVCSCHPPAKKKQGSPSLGAAQAPQTSDIERKLATVTGSLLVVDDQGSRSRDLATLLASLRPRLVKTKDPYYKTQKVFYGVPLAHLLSQLWPDFKASEPGKGVDIEFQAADGYKVRFSSELAHDPAAYLVFADSELDSFAPIGDRAADPSPLYLVWEGNEFTNLETHPRPWAITHIRKLGADQGLELTIPRDGFGHDQTAKSGHDLFARDCIRCHSINQQGGNLGPDLNVPQNILEYRPIAQVRAYIKNPLTFRYGSMPAHPDLSDENLDQLIAYLQIMGKSKVDLKATRP